MNPKPTLQDVTKLLESQGHTQEQISEFMQKITQSAMSDIYGETMLSLSDEDMQAIEAAKDQEEANVVIRRCYIMRTGKNPEDEIQRFLTNFAIGFMQDYHKDNPPQA